MMSSLWFQSLLEVDPGVAEALAAYQDLRAEKSGGGPQEAETCVRDWLADQFPCPNMVVLPGVSQVDLMEPLLARIVTVRLLLVERDHERLAGALNGVDSPAIAQAIRDRRLVVEIGISEEEGIGHFLLAADYSRVPTIRLLDARPLTEEEIRMADEMTRPARDLLRTQACDMSTRKRFGKEWQLQTLRNIPYIIRHPGIQALFGQFAGVPALVVGAGPSLDEAIPFIKKLRQRVVVICVGRAMARFVQLVRFSPDLLITGDGQQKVKKHFEKKPPRVPVVASCFSHPELTGSLDRVFFMEMDAMGLPEWLAGKLGPRGEIFAGGNVSTAGLSLAVALGCNPVLMAGVDFSYAENGKTHARGKMGEVVQLKLPETQAYYDVPGNYRPTVKTNRQMMHYIDFTKDLIAHHSGTTFVNVNTAGARIEGAQLIRPEEMERFVGPVLDASRKISEIYEAHVQSVDAGGFCESLREDIRSLQSLRTQCLDAAMICNQMIMLLRRPNSVPNAEETLRAALMQLEPLDERLKSDPVMNLIESRLEKVSRLLAQKMMSPEELALSPAVRSFWRWREYYKGVAEAGQRTREQLVDVIREIEKTLPSPDPADLEINPEEKEKTYDLATV